MTVPLPIPPGAALPLIAPSLLSADFARLGEEATSVLQAGADWIHFDVMDNHFVPNLTLGPMVCASLCRHLSRRPAGPDPGPGPRPSPWIDAHLMVSPVDGLAEAFAGAGARSISVHPEATIHLDRSLARIRDLGCAAGVVLNPSTPLEAVEWVLERLDFVLVMTVNPGFGGQAFIPAMLPKIAALRARLDAYRESSGRHIAIEVDGGIKPGNARAVVRAGADILVAGSAVFGAEAYGEAIGALRREGTAGLDERA